tara:strand:+ start:330 stop:539 length:210 start_codon:yes stop_codon:yes gene_type:complete
MVAKIPNRKNMGKLFTDENEYLNHLEKVEIVKDGYEEQFLNKEYKGRGRPKKCIDNMKKNYGEYILSFD